MASYNFYDNEERPLRNRFSSIVPEQDETLRRSINLWRQVFNSDTGLPPESEMKNLISALRVLPTLPPTNSCPRLFVSHRQIDKDYGLRIANIANDNGFDFWLDVLDPALTAIPTLGHLSPAQIVLLTACVIEMGLINSTHVLAVMTKDTKGSEWVPYEYGRVRQVSNTSCWEYQNPADPPFTLPDYMFLGNITKGESDISTWLSTFARCPPIRWTWPTTNLLP